MANKFGLLIFLLITMCLPYCLAQVGCTPAITSLSPCLAYLTSSSVSKPSESCCSQVAAVVKTQAQCLCSFLGSSNAAQFGAIINQAQAISLPGACKIDNSKANQCNAASSSQTPEAQSPLGALSPASQNTPSDQTPTKASSPSSLQGIPGGSGKAGESSAAEVSVKFMNPVMLLLLVISYSSILTVF